MPNLPEGLEQRHTRLGRERWFVASVLPTLFLGGIVLAALLGAFGGGPNATERVSSGEAQMILNAPKRLRNGEFFEMRITIRARSNLARPTLLVTSGYWKDLTINTMIPAAGKESAQVGRYRFEYGAMAPGDELTIKIDGQINPSLFSGTRGVLTLADGDRQVLELPVELEVLP